MVLVITPVYILIPTKIITIIIIYIIFLIDLQFNILHNEDSRVETDSLLILSYMQQFEKYIKKQEV